MKQPTSHGLFLLVPVTQYGTSSQVVSFPNLLDSFPVPLGMRPSAIAYREEVQDGTCIKGAHVTGGGEGDWGSLRD